MNLSAKKLLPLWLPAASLVAAIALGWLLIAYTHGNLEQSEQRLAAKKAELEEARRRFHRSDEEKATILTYLPAYQALQVQGFIGGERRIEWIEGLKAADKKAGLDGVQYRIDPQENFEHGSDGPMVQRLRRSTMHLILGLTHEADLVEFLNALRAHPVGVSMVRSCVLSALPVGEPAPRKANLEAQCDIDWVSLTPPGGPST
jgi:hypothetical protein